jgi:hypothetical protein
MAPPWGGELHQPYPIKPTKWKGRSQWKVDGKLMRPTDKKSQVMVI